MRCQLAIKESLCIEDAWMVAGLLWQLPLRAADINVVNHNGTIKESYYSNHPMASEITSCGVCMTLRLLRNIDVITSSVYAAMRIQINNNKPYKDLNIRNDYFWLNGDRDSRRQFCYKMAELCVQEDKSLVSE